MGIQIHRNLSEAALSNGCVESPSDFPRNMSFGSIGASSREAADPMDYLDVQHILKICLLYEVLYMRRISPPGLIWAINDVTKRVDLRLSFEFYVHRDLEIVLQHAIIQVPEWPIHASVRAVLHEDQGALNVPRFLALLGASAWVYGAIIFRRNDDNGFVFDVQRYRVKEITTEYKASSA